MLFFVLYSVFACLQSAALEFTVSSGGNENYFYRDNVTTAQVLLTNSTTSNRRFVAAIPAGNSGALTYFVPSNNNASLDVTLVNGSLTSTTDEYGNVGVQADLLFSENATLGSTIIGAVRAMRDFVEGGSLDIFFNYSLESFNSTSVRLHRRNINTTDPESSLYKGADLYLSVPPASNAQISAAPRMNDTPVVNVIVPEDGSATIRIRFLTNETSLTGLDTPSLFLPEYQGSTLGLKTALHGLSDGSNPIAQQVSFLTYSDKFTAGGWRFLTYFGRDTMIALRLLMPLMTSDAIEAALGAVIERANSTGALCHEETIGDYASFVNILNGQGELGNKPYYDYKMVDTDLLLLPALSHYFLDLPQGKDRSSQFLTKNATLQNGTYGDILQRIADYNLERALPFFQNQTFENLIAFRPGEPVGNWRDSNQGTGYGVIPFDVNSALVPASLRATQSLADADILKKSTTVAVGDVADIWETKVLPFFLVNVDEATAEERLQSFVDSPSSGLGPSALNGTSARNVSFYALSLRSDGSTVDVLNSDLGFGLLYGTNISEAFLQRVVDALTDYPRGLLTDVGMVVANPAYDSNRTNVDVLNRAAYHGTVIWSFQQGLMAGGLERQLGFCDGNRSTAVDINPPPNPKPTWCSDSDLIQNLRDAQSRLWTSIKGAQEQIYSEVWSYSYDNATNTFSVADLVSLSGGVESDAIQLWSYGFLGLLDPETSV